MAVLLAALVVSTLATNDVASARELSRGTFQVSGSSTALFSSSSYDYDGENTGDIDTYNLSIEGLYHVVNNIGVGILGYYRHTDFEGYGTDTALHVGPVLQVSIPLNRMTNLALAVSGGYAHQERDHDTDYDYDGFFYGARGGVALFPVESFSIDLGVSYLNKEVELRDTEEEQEDIAATVGLSVYF
jgi:hypothetical protein